MPTDPVIAEFSKYLPAEALAQKHAANDYGEDYYDDEEADKEKEEPEEEEEEPEEVEEPEEEGEPKPLEEGAVKAEEEEGKESEYEDEDEGYGEEDYDAEGKYKWGNEGPDWDWYYKEDKEAYERGDLMPNTLNPPVHLDQATIERALQSRAEAETARSAISASSALSKESSAAGGVYRTNNRKQPKGAPPSGTTDASGDWRKF